MTPDMKLFVAVYDDCALLPHFLKHYQSMGVKKFYIAASPAVVPIVRRDAIGFDAVVRDDLDVADSFQGGALAVTAMRFDYSDEDEWVLIADLDEFLARDTPLPEVLAKAIAEDANVVRARMVDRVSVDGSLPAVLEGTDLWETFPRECALTKQLQGSVDHKGLLVRGHLLPTMAHHEFRDERICSQWLRLHHFKWNSNAEARLRVAMELARASEINWWIEYDRVLRHLDAHGRLRWEDFPPPD
jgi:hypothetical protein